MPGMQTPSENEIIKKYGVSNTTARKVLSELESLGYATRIKGKGTFVRSRYVDKTVTRILGFSNNMRQSGFVPSTKLLHTKLIKSGYSMTISGRFYAIKGPVLQIHRLRLANNVPIMLEWRFISLKLCPGIEKMNLQTSLYDIYEKNYDLKLTQVDQMLSVLPNLNPNILNLFELNENTPSFLLTGATFCGKGTILEMEESIFRGDKYSFSVKAT